MIDPIRIHHEDDEKRVYERHRQIEARLEHFGADNVRSMIGHGFPTTWNPIITAWLNGERVKAPEKTDA
jgi:hypothetical protein